MSGLAFAIALLGHLCNGIVFLVDKVLLQSAFKRSATYAALMGILSLVVIVLVPWMTRWPQGIVLVIALASGALFILALWTFYEALARGEASRVVVIVGSTLPIFTLIGSRLFLHEQLSLMQIIGCLFLAIATVGFVHGRTNTKTSFAPILEYAFLSALLFTATFLTAKVVYNDVGFLSGLVVTRLGSVLAACFVLMFEPLAVMELVAMVSKKQDKGKREQQKRIRGATIFALAGQACGVLGFVLVQYATSIGSVTLVNALQTVQYLFLFVMASVLHPVFPQAFPRVPLSTRRVIFILLSIASAGIGLVLVAR